jgi:hypothetical protein
MNLQTIIFSKDRALQLHGTLESLRLRCFEGRHLPVSVIYRSSAPEYAEGYRILRDELQGKMEIAWIEERNFKADLLAQLESPKGDQSGFFSRFFAAAPALRQQHVMFLVDDNLFVRDFSMADVIRELGASPKSLGFSLRVGRNTTYCYSNRCEQKLPDFSSVAPGILRFRWPGEQGDFNYPLEVSSSVYRTTDLIGLLRNLPYSNPNRLEQGLSVSSKLFIRHRPELLCFEQSIAFCAPVNKVQSILDNRAGSAEEYSSAALNDMFLAGRRIDVAKLNGFAANAAHQEIELPILQA